ncbi:MAG: NAD(P)H-hydrate dehydratase [Bacteroidales bacterium]|jgi:NAD(P)H-hydrate epimerase|nr:NAD(P)H-hydrate dehydratase [Bacteroidales bacterium]
MQRNKLFQSEQVRYIDNFTIEAESINSIDLMERAARNLLRYIEKRTNIYSSSFIIVSGTGNNGGDGLAIARMLLELNVKVKVIFCRFSDNISKDCKTNLERLSSLAPDILDIYSDSENIHIDKDYIIIDCLFGSGLGRPVSGEFGKIIDKINISGNYVISIDMPSGLFGEDNSGNNGKIVNADTTLTIQFPPVSSMFPENYKYYGELVVVPIGLSEEAIEQTETNYYVTDINYVKSKIKKRKRFDHKGTYGHAFIISGSYGKGGAAVLCSKACIKSGAGLVTTHVPAKLTDILQVSVPEVMLEIDKDEKMFTSINNITTVNNNYTSVGIGPGLGQNDITKNAVLEFLKNNDLPVVVDADAINILAAASDFKEFLKYGTILTPHPKEFERLFGKFENTWNKLEFMRDLSQRTGVIIILKGGITLISLPDGRVFFNTGGNPGMATAGSGDVLTGIITSFLAQGYKPEDSAVMGVFIHSFAGDLAKDKYGLNAMTASDIINKLHKVFVNIE